MANEIKLSLVVDDKGTVILKQFGKDGADSLDKVDKSGKKLTSGLIKLGAAVGGIYVLKKAFGAVAGAVKEWTAAANIQEQAETDLEAVIRSTGMAAGYNLDQMKKMASGMQAATKVGDEVIIGGQAILSTFKKVRGEGFERATMAALNMSQVMKQDVKSSMVMIGKALNDPIANLSAMTRTGVQFTDQQKEMIKILWESGDAVGAQNIILQELESQFGGAAKAAAQIFGGALEQNKNILGDVKEELGFVITKNQFFIDLVHMGTAEFQRWGEYIKENRVELMKLAKDGVLGVADGILFAVKTLKFFHEGWLGIRLVGTMALGGISIALEAVLKGLEILFKPLDLIFDGLVKLGKIEINPFDQAKGALENFKLASFDVSNDILNDIKNVNNGYNKVIETLEDKRAAIAAIGVEQQKTVTQKIIPAINAESKAYDKATKEQIDRTKKLEKQRIDSLVKQAKIEDDYLLGALDAWREYDTQISKMNTKQAKEDKKLAGDRLRAYQSMYSDIKGFAQDSYSLQIKLIDQQAEKYKELGVDAETVAAWISQKQSEAWIDMARDSDDFFQGVKAGFVEAQNSAQTWGTFGADVVKKFSQESKAVVSDVLFDGLTGQFDDIGDYWDRLWESMLRTATNRAAEIVINAGTNLVSGLIGGGGGGDLGLLGSIGEWLWNDILGFQTGLWDVPGAGPVGVHAGEMIIPAEIAKKLRDMVAGAGYEAGGMEFEGLSALVSAMETTGGETGWYNDMVSSRILEGGIRSAIQTGLKGTVSGVDPSDLFGGMLAMSILGSIRSSIAVGQISGWGQTGSKLGGLLGGKVGGPIGGLLGSIFGSTLLDAIGDIFDARGPAESFFDQVESYFGEIYGRDMAHTLIGADFAKGFSDEIQQLIIDEASKIFAHEAETGGISGDIGAGFDLAGESEAEMLAGMGIYGGFAKGTGLKGLPKTGWFYGHAGEIIANPQQSNIVRETVREGGPVNRGGDIYIYLMIDGEKFGPVMVKQARTNSDLITTLREVL